MGTVYALFVGIDNYLQRPLKGCVNDAKAAEEWLWRQTAVTAQIRRLHNEQATKSARIEGIEAHLGQCGAGDTALLWFSGHGSEKKTTDPREATGKSQALVCHDSLLPGGQSFLRDQELGKLLDEIAHHDAHVLAVLDCCHAGVPPVIWIPRPGLAAWSGNPGGSRRPPRAPATAVARGRN